MRHILRAFEKDWLNERLVNKVNEGAKKEAKCLSKDMCNFVYIMKW